MLRSILEVIVSLVLLFAWVTGQLDPLQKKLQEILLDVIGETKVSYGLKSAATGLRRDLLKLLTFPRKLDWQEACRRRKPKEASGSVRQQYWWSLWQGWSWAWTRR